MTSGQVQLRARDESWLHVDSTPLPYQWPLTRSETDEHLLIHDQISFEWMKNHKLCQSRPWLLVSGLALSNEVDTGRGHKCAKDTIYTLKFLVQRAPSRPSEREVNRNSFVSTWMHPSVQSALRPGKKPTSSRQFQSRCLQTSSRLQKL